jgi:hypothetical protein
LLKKSWSCGTIVAYKRAPRERESKMRKRVVSAVERIREKEELLPCAAVNES